jgi:hypothetical protein
LGNKKLFLWFLHGRKLGNTGLCNLLSLLYVSNAIINEHEDQLEIKTRKNIFGNCACYKLEYTSPLFSAIAQNVKKNHLHSKGGVSCSLQYLNSTMEALWCAR